MSKNHTAPRQNAKTVFIIIGLTLVALAMVGVIGKIALGSMRCSWFGSSFEGACEMGGILFVLLVGAVLAALLSVAFVIAYFKRYVAPPGTSAQSCDDSTLHWWTTTFWLAIGCWSAIFFTGLLSDPNLICLPFLVIHGYFAYIVAKPTMRWPLLWVLIAVVLAPIGTAAVFWYMHRARKAASIAPLQP